MTTTSNEKIGMVVNHYISQQGIKTQELLDSVVLQGIRFLRLCPDVSTILVVDGSRLRNEALHLACEQNDTEYIHLGKEIHYAEAYNVGWRRLKEPYIGLMANDIIPNPPQALSAMLTSLRHPEVGCVFPYIDSPRPSPDEVQAPGFLNRGHITCEPCSMTLNLNLFKRETLESIGGVPEEFQVGFTEPIMLMRMRRLGYRAVMVGGARVYHYEQLTKVLGQSTLGQERYLKDQERWFREYSEYAKEGGHAGIDFSVWPYATTTMVKWLWRLTYLFPLKRYRSTAMSMAMWLEPWLTRYPARYGRQA